MQFVLVYVREAHAIDGARPMGRVQIEDPVSDNERQKVASSCVANLKLPMPAVIDRIDDKIGTAYQGLPDRLYLVGIDGKIAYAGGRGPFGFRPDELEFAMIEHLIDVRNMAKKKKAKAKAKNARRVGIERKRAQQDSKRKIK